MTHGEKWNAALRCDPSFDGVFFYAVASTGIFCRPSCKSRPPRRDNVRFFETAADARAAGFRPCKRCRPDLPAFSPAADLAERAKAAIDESFHREQALADRLRALGVTRHRMAELFKVRYGMTPGEYRNALRLDTAKRLLAQGEESILDIAYAVGFESLSAFYRFFRAGAGMPPAAYRKAHAYGRVYP